MHLQLYTGTFGLGHDVPVFQHPEEYDVKVTLDEGGNPTYPRNDGGDWNHEVLHRGFNARSDISLTNCGIALMYAANRPDLISALRGLAALGPVSYENPPLEERTAWVPPENGLLELPAAGGVRRYRVHVAQSGATFEADQADVDLLNRIGAGGCELGLLIGAADAPSDKRARLGRLVDGGMLESAELARVESRRA